MMRCEMKWKTLLLVAAITAAAPASAQKIHIDYDPDYESGRSKTFTFFFVLKCESNSP